MSLRGIDCKIAGWQVVLNDALQNVGDVDLVNVDYTIHGALLETLAADHGRRFVFDVNQQMGTFLHAQKGRA